MRTSIHLSNQSITAAVGEDKGRLLKVKSCHKGMMPAGLVINGRIQDMEQLASYLGGFFNMYHLSRKNISVVIDNDCLANRILDVPIIKRKELKEIIRNEIACKRTEDSELVYDYAVLSPRTEAGNGRILAIAMEKQMIKSYTQLFDLIGVRLAGIDSSLVTAILLCHRISELKGQTYIMSVLCGREMFSLLFADGQYAFSKMTLLNEERGTPAAAVEISHALASMTQFNYAGSNISQLSHAYISGLTGEETRFCTDMSEALSIPVGPPPQTRDIHSSYMQANNINYGEFLFCLGDLLEG